MEFAKALASVKAFLPNDTEVEKIIHMCDLEPIGAGWRLWTDHLGHYLIVKKDRTVTSKKTNPTSKVPFKIKDIHYKSSVKQLSTNSKWAMISLAESVNDGIANICFVWLLGNDDRLRLLCYMKDEWVENKPPLSSGIQSLRTIVKNLEISSYVVLNGASHVSVPYEGNVIKTWLTPWPPNNNAKLDILMTNTTIGKKILTDSGVI